MPTNIDGVRNMLTAFEQGATDVQWPDLPAEMSDLRKRELGALLRQVDNACSYMTIIMDEIADAITEHWSEELGREVSEAASHVGYTNEAMHRAIEELDPEPAARLGKN